MVCYQIPCRFTQPIFPVEASKNPFPTADYSKLEREKDEPMGATAYASLNRDTTQQPVGYMEVKRSDTVGSTDSNGSNDYSRLSRGMGAGQNDDTVSFLTQNRNSLSLSLSLSKYLVLPERWRPWISIIPCLIVFCYSYYFTLLIFIQWVRLEMKLSLSLPLALFPSILLVTATPSNAFFLKTGPKNCNCLFLIVSTCSFLFLPFLALAHLTCPISSTKPHFSWLQSLLYGLWYCPTFTAFVRIQKIAV